MTPATKRFEAGEIAALVEAASDPHFNRWREMIQSAGGCSDPIHLYGHTELVDPSTGEIVFDYDTSNEPDHRLLVACRNRRASRCPGCAETYRADTYHLIRAGLVGGKAVPNSVTSHPRVFATFTAPSFGPVHHRVVDDNGSVLVCHPATGCRVRHLADDALLGQAIDPGSYDYVGAVLWNAMSGACGTGQRPCSFVSSPPLRQSRNRRPAAFAGCRTERSQSSRRGDLFTSM